MNVPFAILSSRPLDLIVSRGGNRGDAACYFSISTISNITSSVPQDSSSQLRVKSLILTLALLVKIKDLTLYPFLILTLALLVKIKDLTLYPFGNRYMATGIN
jgi:hypothetical protein